MTKALAAAGFLLVAALSWSCKDDAPHASTPEAATVDRSQLCKDGGATLNAATNECVCDKTQKWNGIRCERDPAEATAQHLPEAVAPVDSTIQKDGSHEGAGVDLRPGGTPPVAERSAEPAPPVSPAVPAAEERLAAACKHAKAEWIAEERYCLCPGAGVLVGETCRILPGRVTDDACLRAVHKGRWQAGICECAGGLVFSPNRGGCVARYTGTETALLRRTCESSMNRGHWDAAASRCGCPSGRVWADERCQVQERLSSRDVCESAYNKGKWDFERKACRCPDGRAWYNQVCVNAKSVPAKTLCESDQGGGQWNEAVKRCICPRLGKWDEKTSACKG